MRDILREGTEEIREFLEGPAQDLILARRGAEQDLARQLPSVAIYVWRDSPVGSDGALSSDGMWHAVKVEARLPKRCNNACSASAGADPRWPYVRTYTKRWGTKRCYELTSTTGMVKVKVVRFDETQQRTLNFPGGRLLWKIQSGHPARPRNRSHDDLTGGIVSACGEQFDPHLEALDTGPGGTNMTRFSRAFMLTQVPDANNWWFRDPDRAGLFDGYQKCWNFVHTEMLRHGVETNTCAVYYFSGGLYPDSRQGFRLRFVPCDEGFIRGAR